MTDRLAATPGQTIGPLFGYALPYSRSHELIPPAHPQATHLHGTVYDGHGAPVPDALVEIRQADSSGAVPAAEGSLNRDRAVFTGWGRSATDAGGRYRFITIEPGASRPGTAPFFAVAVFARGLLDRLFTRVYLPGDSRALEEDAFLSGLERPRRDTLIGVREPDGSLRFDIHLQGEHETVFLLLGDEGPL